MRRLIASSCSFKASLAVLVMIALAASSVVASAAPVRWLSGDAEIDKATAEQLVELATDVESRHVVLQFAGPVSLKDKTRLSEAGVELMGYLGDHAFFALLSGEGVDVPALLDMKGLTGAAKIQKQWKIHPYVSEGQIPYWAVSQFGSRSSVDVAVLTTFHSDVKLKEQLEILDDHEAILHSTISAINSLIIEIPYDKIDSLADEDGIMWIEWPLPPLTEINAENRARTGADIVHQAPYNLSGAGIDVLVYDGGTVLDSHVDFEGRMTSYDSSGVSSHSTHVACTVGGGGVANADNLGMAPGTTLISYGFEVEGGLQPGFLYTDTGDIEDDYYAAISLHGADISNNSIGTNTAPNGYDCAWEGDYGATSQLIDTIVRGDGSNPKFAHPFRVVWANGNERSSGRCGTEYHTTAPPACAKNHLTVGALVAEDDTMSTFSSWGPTDDDRLKPDVSAPGVNVTSCDSIGTTAYTTKSGTSMAAPTVTGLSALLLEDYRDYYPSDPDFRNSTLRAMFAHTAVDLGNTGPDYIFGYGSVRIEPTINLMRSGNWKEAVVDQSQIFGAIVIVSPGDTELKVTLAWDDVPGLVNTIPELVNDLDLRVFDSSNTRYYPWTLGGLSDPSSPAVQNQEDHINNIEQVYIANPTPGVYRVEIFGYNVPRGPQPFSITASPILVSCSSAGTVGFDGAKYACEDEVEVSVIDCDLNTNDGVIETTTVVVTSDTDPTGEVITLTETGPETADFRGTVDVSTSSGAGVVVVSPGDTLTATYVDADDGQGHVNVVVEEEAAIDCAGPVITNVQIDQVSAESATITFTTSETAVGQILYGSSCGALLQSESNGMYGLEHSIDLTGLDSGTRYFFAIGAEDELGNTGLNDNGGVCFSVTTLSIIYDFPLNSNPGWSTSGQWAFGNPTGNGSYNGDPTSGHTGSNVYGYNLNGDYTDNLAATYLTTTPLDCTGLENTTLSFYRWLGVESESDFDEATIEVSDDGANYQTIWRATDLGSSISDSEWVLQNFDISAIADSQSTVYVRWAMGPTDGGVTYPGWNIDDIRIIASGGALSIGLPDGFPALIAPGVSTDITVRIFEGEESYVPGSGTLHYRYDGGSYSQLPLVSIGGELYRATLPAPTCSSMPEFFFSAEGSVSGTVYEPATAPASVFTTTVGEETVFFDDDFETIQGWTVGSPDDDATTGIWNRGDPEATEAQPEDDHTPDPGVICYVTDHRAGSGQGTYDVDGGQTTLTSPLLDLVDGGNVIVSYWRWYSNDTGGAPNADVFVVDISGDDGDTWVNVETVGPTGEEASGGWFYHEFNVSDIITPTSAMRIRFIASDESTGSLVEAAIDDFFISTTQCEDQETCDDGILNQGEDRIDCGGPCPACECTSDGSCDDSSYCTGVETCDAYGDCTSGTEPCSGDEWCYEDGDACISYGDGDFDTDGDVDLYDFASFAECFGEMATGDCSTANFTGDGEVDLDDYALFIVGMNGPE